MWKHDSVKQSAYAQSVLLASSWPSWCCPRSTIQTQYKQTNYTLLPLVNGLPEMFYCSTVVTHNHTFFIISDIYWFFFFIFFVYESHMYYYQTLSTRIFLHPRSFTFVLFLFIHYLFISISRRTNWLCYRCFCFLNILSWIAWGLSTILFQIATKERTLIGLNTFF